MSEVRYWRKRFVIEYAKKHNVEITPKVLAYFLSTPESEFFGIIPEDALKHTLEWDEKE